MTGPAGETPAAATEQPAADIERVTPVAGSTVDSPFGVEGRGMFGASDSGDTTGFGGLVREPWSAPAATRPFGGYFDEIVDALAAAYPEFDAAVTKIVVDRDELTLYVTKEHIRSVARTMRDDPALRFELLANLSGVDYIGSVNRFHVVYNLTSMTYRRQVRLETSASLDDPHVPSVTGVYPGADWQERETYDMFGVIFDGHPALTRILMPDDWDGYPQRKDYPLGGIPVQYKGATIPPPDERRSYR
jgi:NADH-quinone oxidoreductase subunit C